MRRVGGLGSSGQLVRVAEVGLERVDQKDTGSGGQQDHCRHGQGDPPGGPEGPAGVSGAQEVFPLGPGHHAPHEPAGGVCHGQIGDQAPGLRQLVQLDRQAGVFLDGLLNLAPLVRRDFVVQIG